MTEYMSFANIIICRKELFDAYAEWLFSILFRLEENLKKYDISVEPREMGYISEWLLNVWVNHNHLKTAYKPMYFVEDTQNLKYKYRYLLYKLKLNSLIRPSENLYVSVKKLFKK